MSLAMEETTFLVGKPLSSAQSVPGIKRTWEFCGSSQPSREGSSSSSSSSSWTGASPLSPRRCGMAAAFASLRYPFLKSYASLRFHLPCKVSRWLQSLPQPRASFHRHRLESGALCLSVSGGGEQSSESLRVTFLSQIKHILRVPTAVWFPPERCAMDIIGLVLFLMVAIHAGLKNLFLPQTTGRRHVLHPGSP